MMQSSGRRTILGGLAACPVCLGFGRQVAAGESVHWGYEGEDGPTHWGELSAEFTSWRVGREQTPISLDVAIHAETGAVTMRWAQVPLTVINNGHTIQVACPRGSFSNIANKDHELLQFHFHHPAEHLLNGIRSPMELHFVHKAADGGLAVIGVFIELGAFNPVIQPIWDAMPLAAGTVTKPDVTIELSKLVPPKMAFFRYMGSLTTPPCTEGILWTVFHDPITISRPQLVQFAQIFPNNARPVQPLNRRFLLGAG